MNLNPSSLPPSVSLSCTSTYANESPPTPMQFLCLFWIEYKVHAKKCIIHPFANFRFLYYLLSNIIVSCDVYKGVKHCVYLKSAVNLSCSLVVR